MNNPRTMPLLTTVLFVAVLLSCSVYFGITALIDSSDSFTDAPYRDDTPLPGNLTAFDRGFYLDASLANTMKVADYRLFGLVADRAVVVGEDEFLFPLIDRESGYAYLEDYAGNLPYDEATLDRLAKSIAKRSIAYENEGATYLLAVIPSVQTVYRENLPWGLSGAGGVTRLGQLTNYLAANSSVNFLDLTGCLVFSKREGEVYNNTEDSLSALGAYAVYREVLNHLPEHATEKIHPVSGVSIFTRTTQGKALARAAGVEDLIKNRTLSLSNDTTLKYQTLERIAGVEITYVRAGYKDEIPNRPAVLIECSEEWDKIQLMPYFSNTFGTVGYKTSAAYSRMAVDYLNPTVVVQFIHESQLDELLHEPTLLSYNDAMRPGDDPFAAMTPAVLGIAQSGPDRICIVGRAEQGSTVTLTGDGVANATTTVTNERFILEAVVDPGRTVTTVTLTASITGKQTSPPESLTVTVNPSLTERIVAVGDSSMLFTGNSLNASATTYTRRQLWRVLERYTDEYHTISTATGEQTPLICAYIPDKLDVYPDRLAEAERLPHDNPRLAQLSEALEPYPVRILDLTRTLREARDASEQYRNTDSGLTGEGAYTAYSAIVAELAESDLRIKPLSRDELTFREALVPGGDLLEAIGLDGASMPELTSTVSVTAPRTTSAPSANMTVYTHADEALPTAVILRDRIGTPVVDLLVENFSTVYVLDEGELQLDEDLLAELKPDYILRITSEYLLPLG